MFGLSTEFTIGNRFMISNIVKIEAAYSKNAGGYYIDGVFKDVNITFDKAYYGNDQKISAIQIDRVDYTTPLSAAGVTSALQRVRNAIEANTGKASLANRKLTIETHQR